MTNTQCFEFRGFKKTENNHTDKFDISIGTLTVGDDVFVVHMLKSQNPGNRGDYLVSVVYDKEGAVVWRFQKRYKGFSAFLAEADKDVVVALVTKGKVDIVREVFSLTSLLGNSDPIGLVDLAQLKKLASTFLKCDHSLSEGEQSAEKRMRERRENERKEKLRQQYMERTIQREKDVARITGRCSVSGYTSDGQHRHGTPVVEQEWRSLKDGTFVVLVDSYDDEINECGKLLESFCVRKTPGKNGSQKISCATISAEQPVAFKEKERDSLPTSVGFFVVSIKDEDFEVLVFKSKKELSRVRGSYVIAQDDVPDTKGKVNIYRVDGDGNLVTIGQIKAKSEAA